MNDIIEKKVSGLTIKIERTACIASENCIKAEPNLFELDDERICKFVESDEFIEKDKIVEACSVCPVSALYVYDNDKKQIVP